MSQQGFDILTTDLSWSMLKASVMYQINRYVHKCVATSFDITLEVSFNVICWWQWLLLKNSVCWKHFLLCWSRGEHYFAQQWLIWWLARCHCRAPSLALVCQCENLKQLCKVRLLYVSQSVPSYFGSVSLVLRNTDKCQWLLSSTLQGDKNCEPNLKLKNNSNTSANLNV